MAVRTLYAKLKGLLRKRKKKKREFVFGKKNNFYFLLKRFTWLFLSWTYALNTSEIDELYMTKNSEY